MQRCRMPIDIYLHRGNIYVAYLMLDRQYCYEPFFLDFLSLNYSISLRRTSNDDCLVREFNHPICKKEILYSDVNTLQEEGLDEKELDMLFVFHTSRCGSTLATQILNISPKYFTLSEPPIINRLLDPKCPLNPETILFLLRRCFQDFYLCMPTEASQLVVKFRSWNVFFLEKIISLFPKTPWVFMHRSGAEVLASVLKNPPGWLRAQRTYSAFFSNILRVPESFILECPRDEFALKLICEFITIARNNISTLGTFIDYCMLPQGFAEYIEKQFGVPFTKSERSRMEETVHFYSKDPLKQKLFYSDNQSKLASLTSEQRQMSQFLVETHRSALTNS